MKKWICLLVISCFFFIGCTEDEFLPPATARGNNTFGCVFDGKLFKESVGSFRDYYSGDSIHVFVRESLYNPETYENVAIQLRADNIRLEQGKTYTFLEPKDGQVSAVVIYDGKSYTTSSQHSGEWEITRFDKKRKIISGFFWFDVKGENGKIHQIRRGRFDFNFQDAKNNNPITLDELSF